jgi:hypothetical protein
MNKPAYPHAKSREGWRRQQCATSNRGKKLHGAFLPVTVPSQNRCIAEAAEPLIRRPIRFRGLLDTANMRDAALRADAFDELTDDCCRFHEQTFASLWESQGQALLRTSLS